MTEPALLRDGTPVRLSHLVSCLRLPPISQDLVPGLTGGGGVRPDTVYDGANEARG